MNTIDLTEHDPANHSWLSHVRQGKLKQNDNPISNNGKTEYNEGSEEVVPDRSGVSEMSGENGPQPQR